MKVGRNKLVTIGRSIVNRFLNDNEYRSDEIIAGIDGERFHTHDVHKLVLLLSSDNASPELQVAAMGHDIERFTLLGAGRGYAGERKGFEYEAYKKRHAKKGAEIMAAELRKRKIGERVVGRVMFLITHHDDTEDEIRILNDPELEILVAVDSLSWLNFSAPNYFNGKETKGISGLLDKMSFMLRKLPAQYWEYLPKIYLREPRVSPYLKDWSRKIALERGIPVPKFT